VQNPVLKAVLAAFGTFAVFVTAIYVFGGVVLLLRLQLKGLRGEVVIASLPREFLVSVGLAVLLQFFIYLLVLISAFAQQVEERTALRKSEDAALGEPKVDAAKGADDEAKPSEPEASKALARVLRVGIVGLATAVLAVPLVRWIGWEGVPWWWALVVAYVLLFAFDGMLVFDGIAGARQSSKLGRERGLRWAVALGVIAFAGVVVGLVSVFTFHDPLKLLGVALAALITAVCLWFLLKRLVDDPGKPKLDRDTLWRGALLVLLALLIFIPWRVALEASSIKALDVRVCTANPSAVIGGLFIGENDNSVFVGELPKDGEPPRIAEIPRTEVTRFYLGTKALDTPCPFSLDSFTLSPRKVPGGTTSTGTVVLKGTAPKDGVQMAVSSSNGLAHVTSPITVRGGQSSAFFSVMTAQVKAPTSVVISISFGGVTKTASLTVTSKRAV
jgi:hypothetical protein